MSAAATMQKTTLPYYHGRSSQSASSTPTPSVAVVANNNNNTTNTTTNNNNNNLDTPSTLPAYSSTPSSASATTSAARRRYYNNNTDYSVSYHIERNGKDELLVLDDDTPPPQQMPNTTTTMTTTNKNGSNHSPNINNSRVVSGKRKRDDYYERSNTNNNRPNAIASRPGESKINSTATSASAAAARPPGDDDRRGSKNGLNPASNRSSAAKGDPPTAQYNNGINGNEIRPAKRRLNNVASSTSSSTQHNNKVVKSNYASHIKRIYPPPTPTETSPRYRAPQKDKEGHIVVRPGEYLGGRYKIIRSLGQGTFGKVVECIDHVHLTRVAIKVIRAIPKYRDASKVEIKVLNLLKSCDPHNANKCIHLIDYFDESNHICIVSELLSSSVYDFLKDNQYSPFPPSQIQSFAKQLLKSVAFLHDLRLVHTDLKPENILLVSDQYEMVESRHSPSKKKKILMNSDIRLIDFGSATFEDEYHASVVSTRHYRAPEIIFGLGWSFPCDVWSIGCILIELYTGEALFQTHENLEHLAMMQTVIGPIPHNLGRVAARSKPDWFKPYQSTEGPTLDYPNSSTSRQSRKYVKAMRPLEEIIPSHNIVNSRFQDLLRGLLTWQPDKRLTVKEALNHPFFHVQIKDESTNLADHRSSSSSSSST